MLLCAKHPFHFAIHFSNADNEQFIPAREHKVLIRFYETRFLAIDINLTSIRLKGNQSKVRLLPGEKPGPFGSSDLGEIRSRDACSHVPGFREAEFRVHLSA